MHSQEIQKWGDPRSRGDGLSMPDDVKIIPHTNSIVNMENSIYADFEDVKAVSRLANVKQLGISRNCQDFIGANNGRYLHSLIFATRLDWLAREELVEYDLDRDLGVATALVHDAATTPYSDSVSIPLNLDDQEYFKQVIGNSEKAMELLEEYEIDIKDVDSLVRGEDDSPLGQLIKNEDSIDLDGWSYVNIDSFYSNFVERYPNVDPFESVNVVDGVVVFEDVEKVRRFLNLRRKMFKEMYKSERLKAKEVFFGELVKDMWDEGIIHGDNIFELMDPGFKRLCYDFDEERTRAIFRLDGFEAYENFEAEKSIVEDLLSEQTNERYILREDISVSPNVDIPVLVDDEVRKYSDVNPYQTKELEQELSSDNLVRVYGRSGSKELEDAVERVKERLEC